MITKESGNKVMADFGHNNGRVSLYDITHSALLEELDGGYTYIYRREDGTLEVDGTDFNLVKEFPNAKERRDYVEEFISPFNLSKGEGVLLDFINKSEIQRFGTEEYKNGISNFFGFFSKIEIM